MRPLALMAPVHTRDEPSDDHIIDSECTNEEMLNRHHRRAPAIGGGDREEDSPPVTDRGTR